MNRNVSKKFLELKLDEKDKHYLQLHKVMNKKLEEKTINFKKDLIIYETECHRLEKENERYEDEIRLLKKEMKELKHELKSVRFNLSMSKMDVNILKKRLKNN